MKTTREVPSCCSKGPDTSLHVAESPGRQRSFTGEMWLWVSLGRGQQKLSWGSWSPSICVCGWRNIFAFLELIVKWKQGHKLGKLPVIN
jgi:hypothetical protein